MEWPSSTLSRFELVWTWLSVCLLCKMSRNLETVKERNFHWKTLNTITNLSPQVKILGSFFRRIHQVKAFFLIPIPTCIRSGTVSSNSFISKGFLHKQVEFKFIVHFKHKIVRVWGKIFGQILNYVDLRINRVRVRRAWPVVGWISMLSSGV